MKRQLLIKNGTVINPLTNELTKQDILIEDGILIDISQKNNSIVKEINAEEYFVSPGWIDFHCHVFYKGSGLAINPDILLSTGVTSAVDAGTSGCANFRIFKSSIVDLSILDIKTYLNVYGSGQIDDNIREIFNKQFYKIEEIKRLFKEFFDNLLGLKIRLSNGIADDLSSLQDVVDIARSINTQVCVHTTDPPCDMAEIADTLRPNDIFCHCYHGRGNTILTANGKIKSAILDARKRGVVFDSSNGMGNFSIKVCQAALEQNFYPDIISSDLTMDKINFSPYAKSLPFVMSKYLSLGMPLSNIIRAVTATPARLMKMDGKIGELKSGMQADITIFKIKNYTHTHLDFVQESYKAEKLIVPVMTIKKGAIDFCCADFALF
ncbi:amidohydrolase family protein [Treponema sp. OMZ 840]|uniref:amidohydrolase family protein n=1 Tax=Treponema sp. OMZ 840 TaxID=244313 RepID=UPI003D9373D5